MGKRVEGETLGRSYVNIRPKLTVETLEKVTKKARAKRCGAVTFDFANTLWHYNYTRSPYVESRLDIYGNSYKHAGISDSMEDGTNDGYFSSDIVQFSVATTSSGMNTCSAKVNTTNFDDIDDIPSILLANLSGEASCFVNRDLRDLRMTRGNEYEDVLGTFRVEVEDANLKNERSFSFTSSNEWQVVDIKKGTANVGDMCLIRCPEIGAIFDFEFSTGM